MGFLINPFIEFPPSAPDPIVDEDFDSSTGWTLNAGGSGQTIAGGSLNTPTSPAYGYYSLTLSDNDNWVFQFDMKMTGNRDAPYLALSSDATGYGDPTEAQKKLLFFTGNDDGQLRASLRYYPSGESRTEVNLQDSTGGMDKNVTYFYEATRDGNTFTLAQYGSEANRNNRTSAIQEVATSDITSAYADSPDLAYIVVGGYGSNGQQETLDLKLWNVYF